ncbi:MAG: CBS domain-containing protein [Verrucomicrobiota bacterium]
MPSATNTLPASLNDLPSDDRTALLEELPAAATQKLLNPLSPEKRKIAADLLGYPKDSIGRRLTPEYVAIHHNWNVREVLVTLRKTGRNRKVLNQLYVVDEKGRLVNLVQLRNLVVHELHTPVAEIFENQFHTLRATRDQETAIAAFKKDDKTMLPVLDSRDKLVGVLTVDDIPGSAGKGKHRGHPEDGGHGGIGRDI